MHSETLKNLRCWINDLKEAQRMHTYEYWNLLQTAASDRSKDYSSELISRAQTIARCESELQVARATYENLLMLEEKQNH